jgi:hypothetical protein
MLWIQIMIFAKYQELVLLELKGKSTPVPAKSAGACAKSKNYFEGLREETRADMCIPGGLFIYVGSCAQLCICRSSRCLTKNSILALQKWKTQFVSDEMKISLRGVPHHPKGRARVRYGLVSTNYVMIRAKRSSFDLKTMQPRTW